MNGVLIKSTYKYNGVQLPVSGALVAAFEVTLRDGKVINIANGTAKVDSKDFNFSVYGSNYNLDGVPMAIDGTAIIKELIAYVENDVMS